MHEASLDALKFFTEKYQPATIDDADTFLETKSISSAISEHTQVTQPEVHDFLQENGYCYKLNNELEFTWVLKKKKSN